MGDAAGPPGAGGNWDWLHQTLYERRVVIVTGRLDDGVAAGAAAALVSLDATGNTAIEVQVDSPDGTLEAAFVLIDTLGMIRAPVRALCRGLVGTPAIGVVAAAGYRAAFPHTRFRLAQPTVRLAGTPGEVDAGRRQHRDLLVRFQAHLTRATGRPVDAIADDMIAGRTLDAAEALEYGLIDDISPPSR
jgi:ATP-dependent Clp protease protease subunit